MSRIPFGIRQLDTTVDGGAPPGSVVLLAGEAGAGSREFMYTAAAINGLAEADPELHDLYYGDVAENSRLAEEVHYISFTASPDQIYSEIDLSMDEEIVESGLEPVRFHDLSIPYFHTSKVPRQWYAEETPTIKDLRARHDREGLLGLLGDRKSVV